MRAEASCERVCLLGVALRHPGGLFRKHDILFSLSYIFNWKKILEELSILDDMENKHFCWPPSLKLTPGKTRGIKGWEAFGEMWGYHHALVCVHVHAHVCVCAHVCVEWSCGAFPTEIALARLLVLKGRHVNSVTALPNWRLDVNSSWVLVTSVASLRLPCIMDCSYGKYLSIIFFFFP